MSLPPMAKPPPAPEISRAESPPASAPPTINPIPKMVSSKLLVASRAIRLRSEARWPPTIWPVSCAITPITSLGVLACMSVPVLMNTLWPSTTKALKLSCRTMRMAMFWEPRPAALKIGSE